MASLPRKPVAASKTTSTNANGNDEHQRESTTRSTDHNARRSFLAPITQILFTWLLVFFTAAFFVLTVYYAFDTTLFIKSPLISLSPSNTILIIRVLSGVTSFLLFILVVEVFDRIKWMLVARKSGAAMLDFLTLSSGTGVLGWWTILFAKGKNMASSRGWGLCRIIALILVNGLGIIILSDVSTQLIFINHDDFPVSAGIGNFNASYASDAAVKLVTGIYFATDFSRFLADSTLAIPTTPVDTQWGSCANSNVDTQGCISSYFVPGGLQLVSPWPSKNSTLPGSSTYTIWENFGYQFDFSGLDPSADFDGTTDCTIYGDKSLAIQVCLSISDETTLNTKWISCPISISDSDSCLSDRSWQSSTGFTVSLRPYQRSATTHFSRSNNSILAISDLSPAQPVSIDPLDLFLAYNSSFNSAGSLGEVTTGAQFLNFISTYLALFEAGSQTSEVVIAALRNLIVLPLIYFQPTYLNPSLQPAPDTVAAGLPAELYTRATFSDPEYRLVVGRVSLLVYTIVGAALLGVCVVAVVIGSLEVTAKGIPDETPWPAVDLPICCEGHDAGRAADLSGSLRACRNLSGAQLVQRLQGIRVFAGNESVGSVGAGHAVDV